MKKLEKKILDLIEWGDREKIAEFSGITSETIGVAIKKKQGSRKTVNAIEDYYIHIENVRNEKLQKKATKG